MVSAVCRQMRLAGQGFVIAILCGLAAQAWGTPQATAELQSGSIHGVVVDREGTVYEGARVVLDAEATGRAARVAVSDSNGRFSFAAVPPGVFKLTISAQGFSVQTVSGQLRAGESFEAQPVVLPLSGATSEVRVAASPHEIAALQLREEEKQRVLGIVPNFTVVYARNAPPLSTGQKFQLAWRASIDPFTLLATGASAGIEQADNTFKAYGQGAAGFARRYGATYGDNVIGTMIGSAILPSLLKQDPRYFYKGTGTKKSRVLYAIATSVICKGDNGHWQPDYSRIMADFAAAGISDLYYPASDRNGAAVIFENVLIGKASGAVENLFQEFLARKLTPKRPVQGASKP